MRCAALALLLATPPLTACSGTLEVLAVVDSEGGIGAQVTVELGVAVTHLGDARQIEVSAATGVAVDHAAYLTFDVGAQYSDADLGDGLGQRAGLHLTLLGEAESDFRDLLGEVGVSWSLLGTLDGGPGGIPHAMYWHARDQLGVTVRAGYRGQLGHGSPSRAVLGVGPRYTHVLSSE